MVTSAKKGKRAQWTFEEMSGAISAVRNGDMGLRAASRSYGVPPATLRRHMRGLNRYAPEGSKSLGRRSVLPPEVEQELVDHILECESRLFGFTPKAVQDLSYEIAERHGLQHSFNPEKKSAGRKWLKLFFKRHQEISVRQPEATSVARASGFNRESVTKFFDKLEEQIDEHGLDGTRIYNMDESGISTVQRKCQKILARKGKKQVGSVSSAERGNNTTVVCCASANGHYVPPMVIFKRQRMNMELAHDAPAGSVVTNNSSGWMDKTTFPVWLRHFIGVVKPSVSCKVLLVLDGHGSHTRSLEAIELARAHGVIMLSLPPHTTGKLQPLDVAFFRPLQTFYGQAQETWLRNHPGRKINDFQICSLLNTAYVRAATMVTAVNAFAKTGIWPCNRHIFDEQDFHQAEQPEGSTLHGMAFTSSTQTSPQMSSCTCPGQNVPDQQQPPLETPGTPEPYENIPFSPGTPPQIFLHTSSIPCPCEDIPDRQTLSPLITPGTPEPYEDMPFPPASPRTPEPNSSQANLQHPTGNSRVPVTPEDPDCSITHDMTRPRKRSRRRSGTCRRHMPNFQQSSATEHRQHAPNPRHPRPFMAQRAAPDITSIPPPMRTVNSNPDGRCFFRSVVINQHSPFQNVARDANGLVRDNVLKLQEQCKADSLRAQTIQYMIDHFSDFEDMEAAVNVDMPNRQDQQFTSLQERILHIMSDPTTPVGELEIVATSEVLKRPVHIIQLERGTVLKYNEAKFNGTEPVRVLYKAFGDNYGHYDAIVPSEQMSDISPVSAASNATQAKQKRKSRKTESEILTSTPYKKKLVEWHANRSKSSSRSAKSQVRSSKSSTKARRQLSFATEKKNASGENPEMTRREPGSPRRQIFSFKGFVCDGCQ